jgi:VIT1/CCC1 family predicted Fe2+/Mn2+ transporter
MSKIPNSTDNSHRRKIDRAQSGTARAALLGISDGLVTNVSLILGVTAAGATPQLVRAAGSASLIAGAISMAVGEYISMRGQVELLSSVLEVEREQLNNDPGAAHQALEQVLFDDGVTQKTAHAASLEIARDPEKAMAVYARGNLGINPQKLGSAWGSAFSSLITFAIGAAIPLLPWFATNGATAVVSSLALAIVAAFGIGAFLGSSTNGHWLMASLRQVLVLVLAAGATYFIGRLFHTSVG